ncbi:MAG: hypothetical protein D6812_16580 [Deltaproteobacteria bacterium]|nr:MAG: hypothetical protein D6812_16580 [Deltaproteobacteria bacterium]
MTVGEIGNADPGDGRVVGFDTSRLREDSKGVGPIGGEGPTLPFPTLSILRGVDTRGGCEELFQIWAVGGTKMAIIRVCASDRCM